MRRTWAWVDRMGVVAPTAGLLVLGCLILGCLAAGCAGESLEGTGGPNTSAAGAPAGAAAPPGAPGATPQAPAQQTPQPPGSDATPAAPDPGTPQPDSPAAPGTPGSPGAPGPTPDAPGAPAPGNPDPANPPTAAADCDPNDPWVGPGASEICGDWIDDDCDGEDAPCPTTAATVTVPEWDCQGSPPDNVLAWAPVEGRAQACGVVFEAAEAYYFAPINFDFMCPQRYQARYFAWTTTEATCETLSLVAFFDFDRPSDFSEYGEDFDYDRQPTSNACRKSLMYLAGDLPFSYMAADAQAVRDRLALFPTLEVGCHEWTGTSNFAPVQFSKLPFTLL